MIGELTLDGRIRCVPGVLPMTMAAAARGIDTVYVPEPQTAEAAMVPGVRVFGIRSLGQVVALLKGEPVPEAPEVEPMSGSPLLTWRGEERLEDLDMADVLGMEDARYAVEVAAAGGHHLMLTGPKGSGKTTLAERIPGLLPDLGRRRVPRAHRGALALRRAAGRRLADRPAAVPGAAPLGLAHRASSEAAAAACDPGR